MRNANTKLFGVANLRFLQVFTRKHQWQRIVVIFFLALALRLVVLDLTFPGNDKVKYYDDGRIALNIVGGRGFSIDYNYRNWLYYTKFLKSTRIDDLMTVGTKPTASKQPLYPFVLATFFQLFGAKNFLSVFLFHALISSLTSVLLFLALKTSYPLAGLVAGVGTAIYPAFIWHAVTVPESTTLSLFQLAAFFLCLETLRIQPSRWIWALAGLLGALQALTEPVTIPFLGLCLSYVAFLPEESRKRTIAGFLTAVVAGCLVVTPWIVRNYLVFDRFPVIKGSSGFTFNFALEDSGRGTWIPEHRIVALERAGRNLTEMEEDEAIRREIWSLFPSHLREYLIVNVPLNFLHFWWDVRRYSDDYSPGYLASRRLPYLTLLILSIPSILKLIGRFVKDPRVGSKDSIVPVAALFLLLTQSAVYTLFGAWMARYRFPAEMCLFVFAGLTSQPFIESLWNRWMPASRQVGDDHVSHVPALSPKV